MSMQRAHKLLHGSLDVFVDVLRRLAVRSGVIDITKKQIVAGLKGVQGG